MTTNRPTIDFSGPSRQTAREYAEAANTFLLRGASQADLKAVSLGLQVDAYNLNEALLDAMRAATTRIGNSPGRRELARKIAYLGHITQAVLEAHADGLPAYAEGDRSRKIEELKTEVAELENRYLDAVRERNEERAGRLTAQERLIDLDEALTEAQARASRVESQFKDIKASANEEVSRLKEEAADSRAERDLLDQVLQYAFERLSGADQQRVFGYWDGLLAD